MKKHLIVHLFVLAALVFVSHAGATSSLVFDEIVESYEGMRLSLVDDSTDGIAARARQIAERVRGASGEVADADVQALLPEIAKAADSLAETRDIAVAREAFYELSKLLVRFHAKVTGDDKPVVMYCSMAKKSWLQPAGEVGNPYHGQSMSKCGEKVG